jgi:CP family cyanate transporter-like MFS transporter
VPSRRTAGRYGLVSALYVTSVQLGTVIPALAAVPVADATTWRVSLGVWSAFGFAAVLLWLLISGGHVAERVSSTHVSPDRQIGRIPVWRTGLGWGMTVLFGATSFITYSLVGAGASRAFAGSMVGLFPIVSLAGALLAPIVVAGMRNPFPLIAVCVIADGAGFAGFCTAPMAAPLLWVALTGLGMCTFPISLVLINIRSRTPEGSAALSTFTQAVGYLIGGIGPVSFGVLHRVSGGWGVPLAMLGAAAVAVAVGGWMSCRPHCIEDVPARTPVGCRFYRIFRRH